MTLNLALVISGNAAGGKQAIQDTKGDVRSLGQEARQTSAVMASANDQATAASKRATAALIGQAAAERDLRASIERRLGLGTNVASVGTPFAGNAERGRDIAAYGDQLDELRAKFNPVFAASKAYEAQLGEINRAHALGAISTQEQSAAVARLNAQYQALAGGVDVAAASQMRFAGASGNAGFATANVAAQLNDIGVMMASGQSPFIMAIQQGTQLNQVIGHMGARGAVGALGSAFLSLINPVSLSTIAIIAAAGYAFQYFTDVGDGADDSAKALEDQASLIQSVAKEWGAALPALKAYADERQRLADIEDIRQATDIAVNDKWKELRGEIDDVNVRVADLVITLSQAGAESEQIGAVQREFNELKTAIAAGTATARDAREVQAALMELFPTFGAYVSDLAGRFDGLAGAIGKASAASQQLQLQEAAKVRPQTTGGPARYPPPLALPDSVSETPERRVDPYFDDPITRRRGRTGKSDIEKMKDNYNDLVRSAQQFIAEQELEARTLGMTEEAASRLRYEQDLLNKAANDDIKLKPQQIEELKRYAAGMAAAEEAARQSAEEMDFQRDVLGGSLSDLSRALDDGKISWEELGDAALNALDKIIGKIEDELLDAIFEANNAASGGGGGGFLSQVGNFLGSLFGFGGGGGGGASDPWAGLRSTSVLQAHDGRYPGNPGTKRLADPAWFVGAQRYHSGRIPGLAPDEEAAIVRKSEPIFRDMNHARQVVGGLNSSGASGGGTTTVRLIMPEGWRTEIVSEARKGAQGDTVQIVADYDRAREERFQNGAAR